MATLPELLQTMVNMQRSNLHLTTDTPPKIRVHKHLRRLPMPNLTPTETKSLTYNILTNTQKKRFEETMELDFSFSIHGVARFRGNLFSQRGSVRSVFQLIPKQIRSFGELKLPAVL